MGNYNFVCGSSNKFRKNVLELLSGFDKGFVGMDFGAGRGDFKEFILNIFSDAMVYSVDVHKKSDIDHNLFMGHNSNKLVEYGGKFDFVHSSLVFHEIYSDYELADQFGSPLSDASSNILSNLYFCLKERGYLIVEDFVKKPFKFYFKNSIQASIFLNSEYKILIDYLDKNFIKGFNSLDNQDKLKRIDVLFEFLQKYFPIESKNLKLFLIEMFIDYEGFKLWEVNNNLEDFFKVVRKYLEHHQRITKRDYIMAFKKSGFKKVKVVEDGLVCQFIFKK